MSNDKALPEIDWNDDEAVVRAARPKCIIPRDGILLLDIGEVVVYSSWYDAREQDRIVQAFEREHNPSRLPSSTPKVSAAQADGKFLCPKCDPLNVPTMSGKCVACGYTYRELTPPARDEEFEKWWITTHPHPWPDGGYVEFSSAAGEVRDWGFRREEAREAWQAALASVLPTPKSEDGTTDIEREQARWQNAIYSYLIQECGDSIDGGGCDSGDPLDFTMSEISQAIGILKDRASKAQALPEVQDADRDDLTPSIQESEVE